MHKDMKDFLVFVSHVFLVIVGIVSLAATIDLLIASPPPSPRSATWMVGVAAGFVACRACAMVADHWRA